MVFHFLVIQIFSDLDMCYLVTVIRGGQDKTLEVAITTDNILKLWSPLHFVVQSLSCIWLFVTPWTAACQASLSFTISQSLLKPMSIELVMSSNHFILCCPFLFLPSIFPSISVFSSELALCIRWWKYWSFSFSIGLPRNIQGWFLLGLTGWNSLQSKGLSRVFFDTWAQKHQLFGAQPSSWSNSHIHTWVLEKPQLWLYRPLSAKWSL